jgi:electron transport complex protein RnfB
VGFKKMNHFVIASDCTGCGLCVSYCPVDCIEMEVDHLSHHGALSLADEYRSLHENKITKQIQPALKKESRAAIKDSLSDLLGGEFE